MAEQSASAEEDIATKDIAVASTINISTAKTKEKPMSRVHDIPKINRQCFHRPLRWTLREREGRAMREEEGEKEGRVMVVREGEGRVMVVRKGEEVGRGREVEERVTAVRLGRVMVVGGRAGGGVGRG